MHDLLLVKLFDVKYYRDLEVWVGGRSRSLKMVPFNRLYTTFCWSAVVNTALSCTSFELFVIE